MVEYKDLTSGSSFVSDASIFSSQSSYAAKIISVSSCHSFFGSSDGNIIKKS